MILVATALVVATMGWVRLDPSLGEPAMLEEPCIIQMTIDRYHAMLSGHLAGRERARIEQLLAEANNQLAEAIRQLARAIDLDQRDDAAGQVLS
jgi:hypothetical protein